MQNCELQTPCYVLSEDRFSQNVACMREAFAAHWGDRLLLGYSIKTNRQKEFLRLAFDLGMLAETVSDDEYWLALQLGFPADRIVLNGPVKSEECLLNALRGGSYVNLDHPTKLISWKRMPTNLRAEKFAADCASISIWRRNVRAKRRRAARSAGSASAWKTGILKTRCGA